MRFGVEGRIGRFYILDCHPASEADHHVTMKILALSSNRVGSAPISANSYSFNRSILAILISFLELRGSGYVRTLFENKFLKVFKRGSD